MTDEDPFSLAVLGTKERAKWAAQETADTLDGGQWDPVGYQSRETYRHGRVGAGLSAEGKSELQITGRWLALVYATCERNRGRFQSLLQSACVATREGLDCADVLWGFLLAKWDWPAAGEIPADAQECVEITKAMVAIPDGLDALSYGQELAASSRRDV